MKSAVTFLLFAALLGFSPFSAAASPDTKIFLDHDEDGTNPKNITITEWYISPEKLGQLQANNPATDNPLLSVKQAVAIAQNDVKKNLKPGEKIWLLDSIELHQIDRGNSGVTAPSDWTTDDTGKWFYKVIFLTQRPDPVTKIYTSPYPVYVLMDGTVASKRVRSRTPEELKEDDDLGQSVSDAVKAKLK